MSQKGRKSRPKAARFREFPMNQRRMIAIGAVAGLMSLATVAWVVLSPGWAVGMLDRVTGQQLGRNFSAESAHLDFSPLSLRLEGPALSGGSDRSDSLIRAKSMVIPISFGQIVARQPDLSAISLREAEFALLIDERGQASWDFPEAAPGRALNITLEQAAFRYFDARNGQALALSNVDGVLQFAADGGVTFRGSAVIASRVARIDFELRSLPRVNADGSPLEIAVESEALALSFSGRLATGRVLSLTGPLSLTSKETAELARWAGFDIPQTQSLPGPLAVHGGLDSAGRAYAIRKAAVTLGEFRSTGDVVTDFRGERPKLQVTLEADRLWLDQLVPSGGNSGAGWGSAVLPLSHLRVMDAEVSILGASASYRGLETGPARLAGTVTDGRLDASGAFRLASGGTATFTAKVDSVVLPPSGSLGIEAENADLGPLLGALTGVSALAGSGNMKLDLTAQGRTQEELVGTLSGSASLALAGGQVQGVDLTATAGALKERILDGWGALSGGTPLETLNANLSIADGLVTLTSATAASQALQLTLSGTVDLLRRALDLKLAFAPPEAAPLPVPVLITGNLDAPRIYPDIPDILNNPEGGFARLRSALAPPPGN
jgi:hypothetical protein